MLSIYRRFSIHFRDSLSLVIPNYKNLEHWWLKMLFYCNVVIPPYKVSMSAVLLEICMHWVNRVSALRLIRLFILQKNQNNQSFTLFKFKLSKRWPSSSKFGKRSAFHNCYQKVMKIMTSIIVVHGVWRYASGHCVSCFPRVNTQSLS